MVNEPIGREISYMDSEYGEIVEHRLFQQQQFVQFSFHICNNNPNYNNNNNYKILRDYQGNRNQVQVAETGPAYSIPCFNDSDFKRVFKKPPRATATLTTTLLLLLSTTILSISEDAGTFLHIKINAKGNTQTQSATKSGHHHFTKSVKFQLKGSHNCCSNLYRILRSIYRRLPFNLLIYIGLFLLLQVRSSTVVIAESSLNYKAHYGISNNGTFNDNGTIKHLKDSTINPNRFGSPINTNNTNWTLAYNQHLQNRSIVAPSVATLRAATISVIGRLNSVTLTPTSAGSIIHGNSSWRTVTVTDHLWNDTIDRADIGQFSPFTFPTFQTICVSIILLLVIFGTIVGNILVCIAVCMVRKLRRPCNYLLVSLALSDLCVAVLVMPIALLNEVFEKWNFGPVLCDIWVSFDVLCCTASILNLCAISVDRYLAITKPLEYGVKRTPRRMMLCVALVWLAAACISLPPLLILGNEHHDEKGIPTCTVCQNFAYQIYATLGSFYIPLAVMLFVYYQIFRAARRIVLEEKRAQTHLQHVLNGTGTSSQSPPAPPAPPLHTELDYTAGDGAGTGTGSGSGSGTSKQQQGQEEQQQYRQSSYGNTSLNYGGAIAIAGQRGGGGSGSSGLLGSPHHKKLRFQLAKEKKASTTLGIIMSAFTICWLPFFILALIRPFIESESVHVPPTLSSIFLWLGYANSLLNPIIYATLNRDFRKPFQEILYFRCSSLNTMMRENYYQDQYGEPPSQRVMLGDERHGARESFL